MPEKKLPFMWVVVDDAARKTIGASMVPDDQKPIEIVLAGECPRCTHHTEWRHQLWSFPGVSKVTADQAERVEDILGIDRSKGSEDVHARCECGLEHPGKPETEHGCGARFALNVTWPKP